MDIRDIFDVCNVVTIYLFVFMRGFENIKQDVTLIRITPVLMTVRTTICQHRKTCLCCFKSYLPYIKDRKVLAENQERSSLQWINPIR